MLDSDYISRRSKELAGNQESYPEVEVIPSEVSSTSPYFTASIDDISKKISIPENYCFEPVFSEMLAHELGHYYMQPEPFVAEIDTLGPTSVQGIVYEMEAIVWAAYRLGYIKPGVTDDISALWSMGGSRVFKGDVAAFKKVFREVRTRVARKLGERVSPPGFEESLRRLGG